MDEAEDIDDFGHDSRRQRERLWKEGFREGAAEGKESVLQTSFNAGFQQAYCAGRVSGALQGMKTALAALSREQPEAEELRQTSAIFSQSPDLNQDIIRKLQALITDHSDQLEQAGLQQERLQHYILALVLEHVYPQMDKERLEAAAAKLSFKLLPAS